jgi:choline dehydrogenase-like flavoprotein
MCTRMARISARPCCRMAISPDLGVVDEYGAACGYEGLHWIDSSIIPTSIGVNLAMTISAVSERRAERLVARGDDFALPKRPTAMQPGAPSEHVGDRAVVSLSRGSSA